MRLFPSARLIITAAAICLLLSTNIPYSDAVETTTSTQQNTGNAGSDRAYDDYDVAVIEKGLFPFIEQILISQNLTPEHTSLLQKVAAGDADAMFTAAKELQSPDSDKALGQSLFGDKKHSKLKFALQLCTYAADAKDHTLAQARLGRIYADGIDDDESGFKLPPSIERALHYYRQAGDKGHQHALYNVGVLVYEHYGDMVGALQYFQGAGMLAISHPSLADAKITGYAKDAHNAMATDILRMSSQLSLKEVGDCFLFGNVDGSVSDIVNKKWEEAIVAIDVARNLSNENSDDKEEKDSSSGGSVDIKGSMIEANNALAAICYDHYEGLSNMQVFLAFEFLNDVLAVLAQLDNTYAEDARKTSAALENIRATMGLDKKGGNNNKKDEL